MKEDKAFSKQLEEAGVTREELLFIANEAMLETSEGVVDYFVDGKCSKCGSCCGKILPVTQRELKTIRKFIKKNKIKPIKDEICCPFLDNDKCAIYEVRPKICRIYTCHDHCNRIFNPEMESVVTEVQEVTDMQKWFS